MKQTVRLLAAPLSALLTAFCTPAPAAAPPANANSTRALAVVREALQSGASNADATARLREAVATALPLLADNVLATEALETARAKADGLKDDRQAAKILRAALTEVRDTLAFTPTLEAELPAGFPRPTPVGEIRLKRYPTYRLARTGMKGSETTAFWTLFGHIKKNKVAMTAPVEMTYDGKPDRLAGRTRMAFLYGSTEQGKTGKDGGVDVTDVPAATTLSIGMRGDMTEARVADAGKRLATWLKAHPDHVSAGPVRAMGYNSPFVSSSRRYWEVEIPVRKANKPRD